MRLEFACAAERALPELYQTFNRAFEGYVGGSIGFDAASFGHFLAQQQIDLSLSRLAHAAGTPLALGLVARRGYSCRLVAMGVVREASGQGVGRQLLAQLLAEARERGQARYVLEVLEQNPRALALYQRAGFTARQRLVELELHKPEGAPAALEPIDIAEAARLVGCHGEVDLPWQLSGVQLAQLAPPGVAYRLGPSVAVLSNPEQLVVRLHSLLTLPEARRAGHATRLLRALFARHPGKHWHVSAVCPERLAPVLEAAGFRRGPLSQLQMEALL